MEKRVIVTGLIDGLVFGPVDSRRLGKSLGLNPFPAGLKICTFNCPYCECGWTDVPQSRDFKNLKWPAVSAVVEAVAQKIKELETHKIKIDALTFAGNGEPTLYPEFEKLVEALLVLKKDLHQNFKLAVLTNATRLGEPSVVLALQKADVVAYKLDAGNQKLFQEIDLPVDGLTLRDVVETLKRVPKPALQSMFTQGRIDNTTPAAIADWIDTLKAINPAEVQIYTIDRKTPDQRLHPVPVQKLKEIALEVKKALPRTRVDVY